MKIREPLTDCKIEGCDRKTKIIKGFCKFHYGRFIRGTDLNAPFMKMSPVSPFQKEKCSIENCENTIKTKGFCTFHYKRFLFGRDMTAPHRTKHLPKKCSVEGCNNDRLTKGLCNGHYIRFRKQKQDLKSPLIPRRIKCSIEGCPNKHMGRGLCSRHYDRSIREERWNKLIEIKGGVCERCKLSYHFSCYDFHHRDPKQKDYAIGSVIIELDFDILLKEVEKCDLLCSNCHRLTHYNMFDNTKKIVHKKKIDDIIESITLT